MIRLAPPLLIAFSLCACRPGESTTALTTQRDSAGIVIVENHSDMEMDAGGWGIDPEPFLSIGSRDGDEATSLFQVRGAHRLQDGGVAILDNGSAELRVFDGSGSFLRAFGGRGDGPEEFVSVHMGGVVERDTLVVLDVGKRRLTLIHPEVGILRSMLVNEEASRFPVPSGMFADGRIVFDKNERVLWSEGFQDGPARAPIEYRACDLEGRFAGSLGKKTGGELYLEAMEYGGEMRVRQVRRALAKVTQVAVSSDRFYLGSQDVLEIEASDPEGRLLRLIRVREEPHPVTPELWSAFAESEIRRYARDQDAEIRLRRIYQEREESLPPTFPAHGLLKTDALDHLWVEEYRLPGEETHVWSVFDPQGVRLARVTLPRPMEILEIGPDYIVVLVRDEFDVEFVQLFRLRRGAGRGSAAASL